jgi:hypothetical protein
VLEGRRRSKREPRDRRLDSFNLQRHLAALCDIGCIEAPPEARKCLCVAEPFFELPAGPLGASLRVCQTAPTADEVRAERVQLAAAPRRSLRHRVHRGPARGSEVRHTISLSSYPKAPSGIRLLCVAEPFFELPAGPLGASLRVCQTAPTADELCDIGCIEAPPEARKCDTQSAYPRTRRRRVEADLEGSDGA